MTKNQIINEILRDYPELISCHAYKKGIDTIKGMINLPYWKDKKYTHLLTSTIWNSNKNDIEKILHNKRLQSPLYTHLLTPGIFNVSIKNINPSLDLLEEYDVGVYATNRCLRRNVNLQRTLFDI